MSSEDKSPIRIDEGSKINVVNLRGDYKIGEKSDNSMVLSMPASFLAQSENFFVSTYRLAKDIKFQAELAEKENNRDRLHYFHCRNLVLHSKRTGLPSTVLHFPELAGY